MSPSRPLALFLPDRTRSFVVRRTAMKVAGATAAYVFASLAFAESVTPVQLASSLAPSRGAMGLRDAAQTFSALLCSCSALLCSYTLLLFSPLSSSLSLLLSSSSALLSASSPLLSSLLFFSSSSLLFSFLLCAKCRFSTTTVHSSVG